MKLIFDVERFGAAAWVWGKSRKYLIKKVIIPETEHECWNITAASSAIHHVECTVTGLLRGALAWVQAWVTPIKHGRSFQIHRLAFMRLCASSNGHRTEPEEKIWAESGWPAGQRHDTGGREESKGGGEGGCRHDHFGRRYRSKGEVWSAVALKHARSILCALPLLVLARRQMLCGSAAGGARAGEAAHTAASLTHSHAHLVTLDLHKSLTPPPISVFQ